MIDQKAFESHRVKRHELHEDIVNSLHEMIVNKQLKPGSQLPPERELANMFGVSRITLRTAIHSLEQQGLVQRKVGCGTFIKKIHESIVSESLERYFVFGSCTYDELMIARSFIEPNAAMLAANEASPEDLNSLRELVELIELEYSEKNPRQYAAVDASFHEALAIATHNKIIIAIIFAFQKVMRSWIERKVKKEWSEVGIRTHRAVYEAIKDHDPDRARAAMDLHMHYARIELRRHQESP